MANPKTLKRLHSLIWILIFGGLLTLVLGLATERQDAGLGLCLALAGGAAAAVGLALIVVRSRMAVSDRS